MRPDGPSLEKGGQAGPGAGRLAGRRGLRDSGQEVDSGRAVRPLGLEAPLEVCPGQAEAPAGGAARPGLRLAADQENIMDVSLVEGRFGRDPAAGPGGRM